MTHKTVSKDFKLKTECFNNNSQFTAESMSYKELKNYRIEELKTSIFQSFNFSIFIIGESKLGRLVDALALGGDEGRDKLR